MWRVRRADGELLGEGAFFESDYEAAVSRAKYAAAPYMQPGTTLILEIGRMAVLTLHS